MNQSTFLLISVIGFILSYLLGYYHNSNNSLVKNVSITHPASW